MLISGGCGSGQGRGKYTCTIGKRWPIEIAAHYHATLTDFRFKTGSLQMIASLLSVYFVNRTFLSVM